MKPVAFFLLVFCLSCDYDNISRNGASGNNNNDKPSALVGKWTVEKDSVFFAGYQGFVNHLKTDSDYYDFENNGHLVIKEGASTDTALYELRSDTSIYITFKGPALNRVPGNYSINNFSNNLLSLSASGLFPVLEGTTGKVKVEIALKR